MSSQNLNKLYQYLENANYQSAISHYQRYQLKQSDLDMGKIILLAKSYFVMERYQDVIKILSNIKSNSKLPLHYEAQILLYKANYLIGNSIDGILCDLQKLLEKQQTYSYHLKIVKDIQKSIFSPTDISKMDNNKAILSSQYRDFIQLHKLQSCKKMEEGIPMFIIPTRWYQIWQNYTNKQTQNQNGTFPGPITQFEIIDHPFNFYYDASLQKQYTNQFIFKTQKYKILSKSCWQFLKNIYGGVQLKRWNIMINEKTSQVIVEIFLKQIHISKQQTKDQSFVKVQITKKQNWKGLIKKIGKQFGQNGTISQLKGKQKLPINEGQILEDCDTVGKKYIYSLNTNKSQISSNSNISSCSHCKKTQNLKLCQCKLVKYCDYDCLKQDRDKHGKICEIERKRLKQKSAVLSNFNLKERDFGGRKGLVGLRNLGNTCYMNSGLQCLSNTQELTEYFMSNKFMEDINVQNPLGTKGVLACSYAQVIRQMWTDKDEIISPFTLKNAMSKFAGQFSGFGQQDSQQFISYLIDGLQQDLNLVKQKQTFQQKDEILPDQQASLISQQNYAKRIKSFVRDLMVGQFKSTVFCLKCKRVSICFDPYMLISLPIPTFQQVGIFFVPFDSQQGVLKIPIVLKNNLKLQQLIHGLKIVTKKKKSKLQLKVIDAKTLELIKQIGQKDQITYNSLYLTYKQDYIFFYQIPSEYNRSDIIRIDYYQSNSGLISFPRYTYLQKNHTIDEKVKNVVKSFSRYVTRDDPNKYLKGEPIIQGTQNCRFMKVTLQKDPNMLKYTQKKQFKLFQQQQKRTMSLRDCLVAYSQKQLLENQNQWYCNKCKQFKPAQKHMEIYKANKILVLAFKRFNRFRKTRANINFPVNDFNLGQFLKSNKQGKKVIYDLYGVVNHFGSLAGGHYTAFCRNFLNQRWYQFNDSRVSEINPKDIVTEDAYVLFYRRRD